MIKLENISKSYGDVKALNGFSHSFSKERTTVIIGPSGCGKSTLIRLITGLAKPDKGLVNIDGNIVAESNIENIRTRLGYVIQEGGLFPHLSVKENVTITADYLSWESEDINNRYSYLLQLTKLNEKYTDKYPQELSGGERQRVSLMRSLMLDPDLLLLDEPLGALDPLIRFDLQKDLKKIFGELHKTVLIVTHDLSEAIYFADEIILMNEGRIEQRGTSVELLESPANSFVNSFVRAQRQQFK